MIDESVYEPGSMLAPRISGDLDRLGAEFEWTPDRRAAHATHFAGLCRDLELDDLESRELHGLVTDALLRAPDAEEQESWRRQAWANRQHPDAEREERLALVQAHIQSRPALRELLGSTGLGNHPRVIEMLALRAHAIAMRERAGRE